MFFMKKLISYRSPFLPVSALAAQAQVTFGIRAGANASTLSGVRR